MRIRTFGVHLRPVVVALAAALAAASAAAASQAGAPALFCPTSALSTPFLPWGDGSSYALAPDGGLEAGGAGWVLAGGAAVRLGNESYHVLGAGDSRMLVLPPGGSATTPALCVDDSVPTMRFFVSGPLSFASNLTVEARYVDSGGTIAWHPLGTISGTATRWHPSRIFQLPTSIQSPSVQLRFSVAGGFGSYRLDDLYVDPYIRV
jgi:hypothetical protein